MCVRSFLVVVDAEGNANARPGRVVVVPVTRRILNAKKVFENGAGPCDAYR